MHSVVTFLLSLEDVSHTGILTSCGVWLYGIAGVAMCRLHASMTT